ncbi:condensation domain-containing protein, partial [Streptomyces sp. NPDC051815]|uniref:condensation domain-containing protein n=1 Tax=Streptomyces sp. NPDC051815 TaxID=3365674 RepID=UPI003792134B
GLGGDSILSIQVVARARRVGVRITPRQLFEHPTIARLAQHVSTTEAAVTVAPGDTTDVLSPIQQWFGELALGSPAHWNMGVLLALRTDTGENLGEDAVRDALQAVVDGHEALRTRFVTLPGTDGTRAVVDPRTPVALDVADLSALAPDAADTRLRALADALHAGLDLERGPLLRALLAHLGDGRGRRLVLAAHHLVMDAVSWRILLEDLDTALAARAAGRAPDLQGEGTTHRQWAAELRRRAIDPQVIDRVRGDLADLEESAKGNRAGAPLPAPGTEGDAHRAERTLTAERTEALQRALVHRLGGTVEEGLIAAAARAHARCAGLDRVVVELESHGREELHPGIDLTRTVGWFTTLAPLPVDTSGSSPLGTFWDVRGRMRELVHRGIDHGVVRHLSGDTGLTERLRALPAPDVNVNYLGRISSVADRSSALELLAPSYGRVRDPRGVRPAAVLVEGLITDGRLTLEVEHTGRQAADALADALLAELDALTAEDRAPLVAAGLRQELAPVETVRRWAEHWGDLSAVWPLTPMQEGMLFRTLATDGARRSGADAQGVYVEQLTAVLDGDLDPDRFARAWQAAVDRHAVLRGVPVWEDVPAPVLVVPARVELPVTVLDLRAADGGGDPERVLADHVERDRRAGFDLRTGPLVRLTLARLAPDRWAFVWTHHHVLLDGWSLPILLQDVLTHYREEGDGRQPGFEPAPDFGRFARLQARRDPEAGREFWTRRLAGAAPTPLAPAPSGTPGVHREHVVRLSEADTERLRATTARLGVTTAAAVHAAWALTLAAETGSDDVVLGSVGSGRPADLEEADRMVGMFINTVPLRTRIAAGLPLGIWAKEVQEDLTAAQEHIHTPLARIAVWSGHTSAADLFDTAVIVANFPFADLDEPLPGVRLVRAEAHEQTELPLTLTAAPEGARLVLALNHDTAAVPDHRAAALAELLRTALTALAGDTATVGETTAELHARSLRERAGHRRARAARLGSARTR